MERISKRFIKRRMNLAGFTNVVMICLFLLVVFSCNKKKAEEGPDVFYTCSMDPQVMEKKPGNCPICKMELTRTVIPPDQDKGSIRLSQTQIKLGNIITQKAETTSLGKGVQLRGTMVADENRITTISSRVPGRVDKLYFKNPGEFIRKGDKVYEIYSEELQAAIQQFLLLKEKTKQMNGTDIDYPAMTRSAKDKLLVWGMSSAQIESLSSRNASGLIPFYSTSEGVVNDILIREGEYVTEGSSMLEVADYSSLWVEAEVYPKDVHLIRQGVKVNIKPEAYPADRIEGKINFENPELEGQSRISFARIEISNKDGKYKPGMRVTVTAVLKELTTLAIPEEAVLIHPRSEKVWVEKEEGLFVPETVETGIRSNGMVEIKSGIEEGAMVVISGAYLIDSEYTLRKGNTETENNGSEPSSAKHVH